MATEEPSDTAKRSSLAGVVVKTTVSIILLLVLLYQVSGNELAGQVLRQPKRWEWLGFGFMAIAVGYTLSFVRWWCLLQGAGIPERLGNVLRWSLMSQPFQLISFGVAGGDLLRILMLCREHPSRKTHATATVFLDRGIGLWIMLAAVAVIGWLIDWDNLMAVDPARTAGLVQVWKIAMVVVVMVSGVGIVLLLTANSSLPVRAAAWLPGQRMKQWSANLAALLPLYRQRPGVLLAAVLLSAANVLCLSAAVFCVAQSLTRETPGLADHLLLTPVGLIAGAAPLPGGLGSQELVMSWMYAAFSGQSDGLGLGVLVAVGYRGLTLIMAAIGWGVYVTSGRPKLKAV